MWSCRCWRRGSGRKVLTEAWECFQVLVACWQGQVALAQIVAVAWSVEVNASVGEWSWCAAAGDVESRLVV